MQEESGKDERRHSEGIPERKGQPWVEKSLGTRDKECAWFGKSKQIWRKKTSKGPDNYGSMSQVLAKN